MNKKDKALLEHLNLSIESFTDTLNHIKSNYLVCTESEKNTLNNLMRITEEIIKEINNTKKQLIGHLELKK